MNDIHIKKYSVMIIITLRQEYFVSSHLTILPTYHGSSEKKKYFLLEEIEIHVKFKTRRKVLTK